MKIVGAVMFIASIIPLCNSLPFILLHGIGNECSHEGTTNFTNLLTTLSGSHGFCLEVGNGFGDSWFMPLPKQVSVACEKVKQRKELSHGYNIVALSQGNMVARGLIQFCEGGPPVRNYVSLAGPHAGIASVPLCGSNAICRLADELVKGEIYSTFIQDHLAPSGYLKIPTDMSKYLYFSKYLPLLNNENPNEKNSTIKDRFTSLNNLVLVMFQDDKVLVPKETSWFGFYPEGEFEPLLSPQQTKLYREDWIGLKTLDEAGRVKFISVAGEHIRMAHDDVVKYVVPYLQEDQAAFKDKDRTQLPNVNRKIKRN